MAPAIPLINDGNVVDDGVSFEKNTKPTNNHNKSAGSGSAVLHRSLHEDPLRVVSSKGHILHLSNGQKIFDATGGAAVACLGHGNERYDRQIS